MKLYIIVSVIMKSVFVMFSLSVDHQLEGGMTQSPHLYFTSMEKVEQFARNYRQAYSFIYGSDNSSKELYCLVVDEYALDVAYPHKLSTYVYSPEGDLMDGSVLSPEEPFPTEITHQVGDIVEAPCGDYLYVGIVLEQPLRMREGHDTYLRSEEDCYSIITYPSMEVDYIHSPLVFKPKYQVEDQVKAHLKLALDQYLS